MKRIYLLLAISSALLLTACEDREPTQSAKTSKIVERAQGQLTKAQPIPVYQWSLERDLVIQLYNTRNMKALTHSVWRDFGEIEGDCPSIGFGIPYDTSLTNPLVATNTNQKGQSHSHSGGALASIEQPEPNGIFASKNTAATWVMCAGAGGTIEPIYTESKVSVYPYSVSVDYNTNRVKKTGKASVSLTTK